MPSNGITTESSSPAKAEISVEFRPERASGYAAIVSLIGEHDLASSRELAATFAPLVGNVLVDLAPCAFLDSSVIGVIIAKARELAREGARLELVVPPANRNVVRVVDVVGLRTLMTVHAQVPAAEIALELLPSPSSEPATPG